MLGDYCYDSSTLNISGTIPLLNQLNTQFNHFLSWLYGVTEPLQYGQHKFLARSLLHDLLFQHVHQVLNQFVWFCQVVNPVQVVGDVISQAQVKSTSLMKVLSDFVATVYQQLFLDVILLRRYSANVVSWILDDDLSLAEWIFQLWKPILQRFQ